MMTPPPISLILCFLQRITLLFVFTSTLYASPEVKHLKVQGGDIAYFQIGKGSPVLLLHGLFANKEQWLDFVSVLEKQQAPYALIIPDLPGFGESQGFGQSVYNVSEKSNPEVNQVQLLHAFIDALNLKAPIAIAGNSLGGLIAATYAKTYPNEVSSLSFIGSPLGATPPTEHFYQALAQGYNPFIPLTPNQFLSEMNLLMVNVKARMPSKEKIASLLAENKAKAYEKAMIYTMLTPYPNLQALMHPIPEIQVPVMILWGQDDRLFGSVKHAYTLSRQFPQSAFKQVIPLPQAGHVIMLESESVLAKAGGDFLAFLKAAQAKSSVQFA